MKIKASGIDILQKSSAVDQNYFRPKDFNSLQILQNIRQIL